MTFINSIFIAFALGCPQLQAQDAPLQTALADPQRPMAAVEDLTCNAKGCPEMDQHGHRPVKCEYKSGMSTGFRCILFCTYTDSTWGTIVDSSKCN